MSALRPFAIFVAALGLAGCSFAAATPTGEPHGRPRFDIRCDGHMDDCYDKAAEVCRSGYVTTYSGGHVLPHARSAPSFRGYLTVECKGAPVHPG